MKPISIPKKKKKKGKDYVCEKRKEKKHWSKSCRKKREDEQQFVHRKGRKKTDRLVKLQQQVGPGEKEKEGKEPTTRTTKSAKGGEKKREKRATAPPPTKSNS